jgi:hypothetical protein
MNFEGGCLCGRLRFRVTVPVLDSGYCHCRMCQKNSGAPVVAWVTVGKEGFSWIAGRPRPYASSKHAVREFCGRCGGYIVFRNTRCAEVVSINTMCFDEPDAFPPLKHLFVESRISWFQTADDLPCFHDFA